MVTRKERRLQKKMQCVFLLINEISAGGQNVGVPLVPLVRLNCYRMLQHLFDQLLLITFMHQRSGSSFMYITSDQPLGLMAEAMAVLAG